MRSATIVALLGVACVGAVARIASREGTPLHAIFAAVGISGNLLFVIGTVVVIAFSVVGGRKALAGGTLFTIAEEGLHVAGPVGRYLLKWDNIERLGTLFEHDLGIAVVSREAVLNTHSGAPEQRERFERLMREEPYQGWDFHHFRHELGIPVERVLSLLEQARDPKVLVTRVED